MQRSGRTPTAWELSRRRPVLFALFETVLTAACAWMWAVVSALHNLADGPDEAGEPESAFNSPYVVVACAALLSIPVTWALRALPSRRMRRAVEGAVVARLVLAVLFSVWVGVALVWA